MIFHSAFQYDYLWLPLVGFVIGFFSTLIGGGGGFFFIPVLTILFNVPAQVAIGSSLAATLPICIVGSFGHYREGNIDLRMGIVFGLTGIAGALLGAYLANIMTSSQLTDSFGIYSVLIGLQMLYTCLRDKRAKMNGNSPGAETIVRKTVKGSFFGFLAGVITGTFGTSGSAPVMAGLFSIRMPLKLVVGTSLMIVFANTVSALGAHFLVGDIDLTLVWFLTSGAIIGALTGPKFLSGIRIDKAEGSVKIWYALLTVAFGIGMILTR